MLAGSNLFNFSNFLIYINSVITLKILFTPRELSQNDRNV